MMNTRISFILIIVVLCSCEKSYIESKNEFEILIYESFEYENIDDLFGNSEWSGSGSIISDAPINAGDKSIQLSSGWCPSRDLIETCLTGLSNIHVLKLTVWYKFKDLNGMANLNLTKLNADFGISHDISAIDTLWHTIVISDTLAFNVNDSLSLSLSTSCNELINWQVLFDNVRLESLELKLIR